MSKNPLRISHKKVIQKESKQMNQKAHAQGQSRRTFIGRSVAALAAATFLPSAFSCAGSGEPTPAQTEANAETGKVNSKFGGVQIGAITYSFRGLPGGLDNIIKYCQEANLSSIELMGSDLEASLGAPENPMMKIFAQIRAAQPAPKPGEKPAPRMQMPKFTPEQQAEIDKYNEDMKTWRLGLDMAKVEAARQKLADAGISVHIVKMEPSRMKSDEEIDYAFRVSKAMGAGAVTDEISLETAKRVAPFAEKHGIKMAFHNHMQYAEEGFSCDPILAVSPAVMLNFDAGHFFGSTGIHPNEMIKKYHDRIYSIHLKDKTGPKTGDTPNTNQVWGQGEMPIADVLRLVQQEQWPIYCDIELEYDIKPWSNSVKEVGTCVKYARQILM